MEADSTGTYNSTDEGLNVQSPKVQSSFISSCDEETFQNPPACSSSDVTEGSGTIHGKTDEIDVQCKNICTESYFDDSHLALENLHMESTDIQESPKQSESRTDGENTSHNNIILNEKELEHIEDSVLSNYTGLNIDLASENQLLKEDVIKCRCELQKYGKKLAIVERKLDKANSYNDDLRVQVDKLSRELHEYRREKHKVFIHVDTQTSPEDMMEIEIEDDTLYDVNLPGLKPDSDFTFDLAEEKIEDGARDTVTKDDLQTPGMSIADSLKVTAEAAMNQTGFVYDEQSGLYYDYNTGYYYNAEKGLYYDPKSGTYFYYNKSTGKYEFHSQVDLSYYTPSPVSHSHSDRSHSSHRHSYSDKYPVRSPEHESSSGKKKKKKESRRRSSDEKEHKKKKRRKDKSRENSDSSDDEKDKKKRKKSVEDGHQRISQVIEDLNKKLQDTSNIVMGELNYKKLKQSDKLLQDSKRLPKLLSENQANVSICDDVIKGESESTSGGVGLSGKKKIKLVLRKKEKEVEKKDENDMSKEKDQETVKTANEKESSEKGNETNNEINTEKDTGLDRNQDKDIYKSDEALEYSNEGHAQEKLNDVTKMLYRKSMNFSADEKNDQSDEISSQQDNIPSAEKSMEIQNQLSFVQTQNVTEKDALNQENENNVLNELESSKNDNDSLSNPFLISGLDADDDGMLNYENVGIVNNEEILRICSEVNNEKSPEENQTEGVEKDGDVSPHGKGDDEKQDNEHPSCTNITEKQHKENSTDKNNVDNVTNEMLGVDGNEKISNVLEPGERIIKLPVKRNEAGEEDFYSDEDDIMIVEKKEETILIELDSDDDDNEKVAQDGENKSDGVQKKSRLNLEPGELTDSSSSSSSSSSDSQTVDTQPSWVEIVRQPAPPSEESSLNHAPCIRAMVTSSDLLDEGILFVVTIKGGMVGRENRPDLVICVPDINVSKVHAEIRYNSNQQIYTVQDKGSQNGTYVNEERISESKKVSKWIPLKHGDTLQLSCTRFELHIHPGTDTCDKCEPGLVISKQNAKQLATDNRDRKTQHRQQLKSMKKKYGLESFPYTDNTAAINNPKYQDKAKERRHTVGSDNPHKEDDVPASMYRPILETNKGHKLLKKMGWAEGESLGKDNAGIQEPIDVTVRVDRSAGLGAFGRSNEVSIGNIGIVNARRRFMQTQIRYTHADNDKNKEKQFEPKMWVQGDTQGHVESINEEENKDK